MNKIHFYAMAFPDDVDTLPDMLNSSARFADHIYLTDGGFDHALCHRPRYTEPLASWILRQEFTPISHSAENRWDGLWNGVPITLWEHVYQDPAHQRNDILEMMAKEPEQPDWIVAFDSDEVASEQFISGIRSFLESVSPDIRGIYIKRLNLVQDEQHCVDSSQSNWLAHPTICRPGFSFSGAYHEHMLIDRSKCIRWEIWGVIHTRPLFRNRLWVQRGHSSITGGNTPFWNGVHMENVPAGVTWKITWPSTEVPIPFEADILSFEGGRYAQ